MCTDIIIVNSQLKKKTNKNNLQKKKNLSQSSVGFNLEVMKANNWLQGDRAYRVVVTILARNLMIMSSRPVSRQMTL